VTRACGRSTPANPDTITVRLLRTDDIRAVAALLEHLARRSITAEFSEQAQTRFLLANNASAIAGFVAQGFRYHVAEAGGELAGFVGVRNNAHLYHLFVAETMQGKGVARQLWTVAMDACLRAGNPGRFTVNSSNHAVPVYEAFGFTRSAPTQDDAGVLYNPMVLDLNHAA
jgi:GNAT superfamily N-acetyltransferase